MNQYREKRKAFELVKKQFGMVLKSCIKAQKEWDLKLISLTLCNEFIDLIKYHNIEGRKDIENVVEQHNNTCDTLKKTLKTKADKMGANGVPISFIKECINVIITNYKEGLTGK